MPYKLALSVLFSLLVSLPSFAALNWSDLNVGSKYKVGQELKLTLSFDENSDFIIPVGSEVVIKEKMSLDMIKVEMFKVSLSSCQDKDAKAEMQLFDTIQRNGRVITSGVELTENCMLEIFIETKDYYYQSLFR